MGQVAFEQSLKPLLGFGSVEGIIAFHGYRTAQRHGGKITRMIYRYECRVQCDRTWNVYKGKEIRVRNRFVKSSESPRAALLG